MRVRVRASFAADVASQVKWLRAEDQEERVEGLREGLVEVRRLLERFPEAGARTGEPAALRKLILRRLPFVVWYVVERDAVWLVRLFHVRQDRPRRRR